MHPALQQNHASRGRARCLARMPRLAKMARRSRILLCTTGEDAVSAVRDEPRATRVQVSPHKLYAPKAYPGAVARCALLERIVSRSAPPITFLQAPAGHGKSTLLQQLKTHCDGAGFKTGWLSFDDADNDMRRCALHLQALVTSTLGLTADDSPPRPLDETRSPRRRSDWFINHLAAAAGPVALFLDEFQALKSHAILSFFRELFERLPDDVRLFVGSRSTPEVGLVRLVVSHQAMLLRADDLRFSPLEVAKFFADDADLAISFDEVEAIYRQTEGWPAALQLFRLTLGSPTVRNSLPDLETFRPRELAEYLADNVLKLQSTNVQDFLLRTSLLRRLSAPLCDAVLGCSDSQEMLLLLERSGLFLRMLDPGAQWFCYHTLFSSCLADRCLEVSHEVARTVHQRAAVWYRNHDLYEEAMHHAVAIQDFGFAAEVLNIWAARLVANGHLITVERWFDRLPLAEVAARADLAIKVAWTLIFLRRHSKVKPIFAALDAQLGSGTDGTPGPADVVRSMAAIMRDDMTTAFGFVHRVPLRGQRPEGFRAFELGALANLTAFRAIVLGNLEEAREFLALGHAFSDSVDASFSGGYALGLAGVHLIMQGRLPQALGRFRAAMAGEKPDLDKSFSSASLASCYIYALYQAHELDAAEELFNQFRESIADSGLLDFVAVAFLSMARIHEARGRLSSAHETLEAAAAIGHSSGWPRLTRIVDWERVRMAFVHGEAYRAEALAGRLRQELAGDRSLHLLSGFSEDCGGEAIGEIRCAIRAGQLQHAEQLLAQELPRALAEGRVHRQMKLYILDALLQSRSGAPHRARRSLGTALRLAEPGGFISVFLEEGDAVRQLLGEEQPALVAGPVAAIGVSAEFVGRLLDAGGTSPLEARRRENPSALEALTNREIQILVQLTNGASTRETASKIFVSENTVKYHLKNIYTKLNVSSRIQALNAARDLGLIR